MAPNRYVFTHRVGEGGMGVVYAALDREMRRSVAFKVARPSTATASASRASPLDLRAPPPGTPEEEAFAGRVHRFLHEARITGALEHPGVTPVYEVGRLPSGVPYYTMQLVRGSATLADVLERHVGAGIERRLGLLEVFLKVCDAVGYAHSQGVLHRDLKPGNIALGEHGEVLVLDWGLAKAVSADELRETASLGGGPAAPAAPGTTLSGKPLGTPGYMSPEAAQGLTDQIDARSDVFSLGAILYEILSGRLPVRFDSAHEYVARILAEGAAPLEEVQPDVPAPLAAVCRGALSLRREERPAHAGVLADAVRSWQARTAEDQEVEGLLREARGALEACTGLRGNQLLGGLERAAAPCHRVLRLRPSAEEATRLLQASEDLRTRGLAERDREARRRMRRRVLVAAVAALAVLGSGGALVVEAQRRSEAEARGRAEAAGREAQERLADTYASLAMALHRDGRSAAAHLAAARSLDIQPRPEGWAALATVGRAPLPTFRRMGPGVGVRSVAARADGSAFFAGCADGRIREWSLASGRLLAEFYAHEHGVDALALSPDGSRLYSGGRASSQVRVWSVDTHVLLGTIDGLDEGVWSLLFVARGRHLVAAGRQGTLWVCDPTAYAVRWAMSGVVRSFAGSAEADVVAVSDGSTVTAWSLDRRRPLGLWREDRGPVGDLAVSADGTRLYASFHVAAPGDLHPTLEGAAGRVSVRRIGDGAEERVLEGGPGPGVTLWLDDAEGRLYGAPNAPGQIQEWDLPSGRPLRTLPGGGPLAPSRRGSWVFARSPGGSFGLLDTAGGRFVAEVPGGHVGPVVGLEVAGDGQALYSLGEDERLLTWEPREGRLLQSREVGARRLATSRDGRFAALAGGGRVRILRLPAEVLATVVLPQPYISVTCLVMSPDNLRVHAGDDQGTVWTIDTSGWGGPGPLVARAYAVGRHHTGVACVATDETGTLLFSAAGGSGPDDDNAIRVWSPSARVLVRELVGHQAGVSTMVVEPARGLLFTGSLDGTIKTWDLRALDAGPSLEPLAPASTRTAHSDGVAALALSADGRVLASGAGGRRAGPAGADRVYDRTIRLWDARDGSPLQTLEGHEGWIAALRFDPRTRVLYSAGAHDAAVLAWDLGQPAKVRTLQGSRGAILALALQGTRLFGASGDWFGSGDNATREWRADTGDLVRVVTEEVPGYSCSPLDGRCILLRGSRLFCGAFPDWAGRGPSRAAAGGNMRPCDLPTDLPSGTLQVFDVRRNAEEARIQSSDLGESVLVLTAPPKGDVLYAGGDRGSIYVFDTESRTQARAVRRHESAVTALALTGDGRTLYSGARQGAILAWDAGRLEVKGRLAGHTGGVGALLVSRDGGRLYSCGSGRGIYEEELASLRRTDSLVKVWDPVSGGPLGEWGGHAGHIQCAVLSPDERFLFTGSQDGTIRAWDTATGAASAVLDARADAVRAVAMSEDGRVLYSGGHDPRIFAWDVEWMLLDARERYRRIEAATGLRLRDRVVEVAPQADLVELLPGAFRRDEAPAAAESARGGQP